MDKEVKKIQIGLKLDATKNSRLTKEELSLLSHEQLNALRDSVAAYLELIDSIVTP